MTETNVGLEQRQTDLFGDVEAAAGLPGKSIDIVGLRLLDADMPFERWLNVGRMIGHLDRWTPWAFGDWLNFGQAVYGEEFAQGTEGTRQERYDVVGRITGMAPSTLGNYASVAARVPINRRRVELSYGMHEPAARLEPDEQDEWLQRCIDEGWDRETFRKEIRAAKTPSGAVVPDDDGPGLPEAPLRERFFEVGRLLIARASVTPEGVVVPSEAWQQLVTLIGEE